jgi:5-bromo-4-chloroindolyl phosphate hydrolysis protein
MSTAVDIAKTEREARRRRKGKSTRASSKTVSLPDGIVENLEAELEAFQKQMSRWQKFLSNEDEIFFLEKIAKIVDDRLIELNDRCKEVAAA